MNPDKNQNITAGMLFNAIDLGENSVFSSMQHQLKKKMEGRKVLIKKVFKRMGASERSFDCVFIAPNKKSKDFLHTFMESEKFAKAILSAGLATEPNIEHDKND